MSDQAVYDDMQSLHSIVGQLKRQVEAISEHLELLAVRLDYDITILEDRLQKGEIEYSLLDERVDLLIKLVQLQGERLQKGGA